MKNFRWKFAPRCITTSKRTENAKRHQTMHFNWILTLFKNSFDDSEITSFCPDDLCFLSLLTYLADRLIWLSYIAGSTLSEIAAREIVQVEHAALYFGKLSEELSGKNAESIYRTLTGENCTYTGITDTSTLFDGIQTRIPGLTVASFFVALDIIGKRNVARKFHDSFHSDREEILAVNNCIICGGK